ncbi:MAG: BrnA antitoxin family protein, partial [Microcystis panniformis]
MLILLVYLSLVPMDKMLANKKQLVSIRYSPEVIDYFRASGAGWQA